MDWDPTRPWHPRHIRHQAHAVDAAAAPAQPQAQSYIAVWCGVVLDVLAVKAATYGAYNARGSAPPKAGDNALHPWEASGRLPGRTDCDHGPNQWTPRLSQHPQHSRLQQLHHLALQFGRFHLPIHSMAPGMYHPCPNERDTCTGRLPIQCRYHGEPARGINWHASLGFNQANLLMCALSAHHPSQTCLSMSLS